MKLTDTIKGVVIGAFIISLTVLLIWYLQPAPSPSQQESAAYSKGQAYGLYMGFNQGFVSGTQFGIGMMTAAVSLPAKDNSTWYYMQGYNSARERNYTINESLNPYKTYTTDEPYDLDGIEAK